MTTAPLLPDGWESWPPEAKQRVLTLLREHEPSTWIRQARPEQTPPDWTWNTWLILAGRGFGKTRTGGEWAWRKARDLPKSRGALVGPTAADVRDTMVEGESGIMACVPAAFRPVYEPSKRRLTYPNGSMQTAFSAEEPDRLRGPQHHYGWLDEPASYPLLDQVLAMYRLGLRLGRQPQSVMTTTPRPLKALKRMLNDPKVAVTRGSTYDNIDNLAPEFREAVLDLYEGTRLGQQEIHGELLDATDGALWTVDMIDRQRVSDVPPLVTVLVGVDPAVTSGEDADETGIVAAGKGTDGRFYVLADTSGRYTPNGWAGVVRDTATAWNADRVIAEVNNGGDLVVEVLRRASSRMAVRKVTASRGKRVRAEPVAGLYEQGRVSHVGTFPVLEDQLTTWTPQEPGSPDRMDALVWALTALSDREPPRQAVSFRT